MVRRYDSFFRLLDRGCERSCSGVYRRGSQRHDVCLLRNGYRDADCILFGNKDYAKIYSLVPAIGSCSWLHGRAYLTSIYQATGGYNSVWLFCAACDVAIAVCVVLAARNSKKLPRTE